MPRTVSPSDMKALEQRFMAQTGVPGALLMEHAAHGVNAAVERCAGPDDTVLYLCGPGANGGDGYAAARIRAQRGGRVVIRETCAEAKGDALMNRDLCRLLGLDIAPASAPLPPCAVVVDALFGTGLSRPVTGDTLRLIREVNALDVPVIAVDIPSGLSGADGQILGDAVRATETVTFHRVKSGLFLGSGPDCTGRVTLQPIIIPAEYGDEPGFRYLPEDALKRLPPRRRTGNKGTFGRVLIFAGSPGMAGAAAFCARACIRAGAGLTRLLVFRSQLPLMQLLVPGATCTVIPDDADADTLRAVAGEALGQSSAAVIGCGLSADPRLLPVLAAFAAAPCPVVWDADALNLLAAHPEAVRLPETAMMTPHPGEAARLLGTTVAAVTADAPAALRQLREKFGCSVLLKGARTLMTDGADIAVNPCGTPAMAKGGSGDVLSGILAALAGQYPSMDALTRLQYAALIHARAGLLAEERLGECCVTPEALIDAIRLDDASQE